MQKRSLRKLYLLVLLLLVGSAIPIRADVDNPWAYVEAENQPMNCSRNWVEFRYADWQNKGNDDAFVNIEIYVGLKNGSETLLGTMPRCHDEMTLYNTGYGVLHVWGDSGVNGNKDNHGNTWVRTVYMRYYPGDRAIGQLSYLRIKGFWDIDDDGGKGHNVDEIRYIDQANRFEGIGRPTNLNFGRRDYFTVNFTGGSSSSPSNGFSQLMVHNPGGSFSFNGTGTVSGTLSGEITATQDNSVQSRICYTKTDRVKNNSYGSKGGEYNNVTQHFYGESVNTTLDKWPTMTNFSASRDSETLKVTLKWGYYNYTGTTKTLTIFRRKYKSSASDREKIGEVSTNDTQFTEPTCPADPTSGYLYELVCVEPSWNETPGNEIVYVKTSLNPLVQWSGEGTASSPYLIGGIEDLRFLRSYVSAGYPTKGKYWKQTASIDLGGQASPWKPIGFPNKYFEGSYNGQNYELSNMYISMENNNAIGLFSCVTGNESNPVTLENINIKGASVVGSSKVGAIAGDVRGVVYLRHCYVQGTVDGRNSADSFVGGLLGGPEVQLMEDCAFIGNVTGVKNVGGLMGYNSLAYAKITRCFFSGTVNGTSNVGAIVGACAEQLQFDHVYYNLDKAGQFKAIGNTNSDRPGIEGKPESSFSKGEVAVLLNENPENSPVWYQTIGTDAYPVFDSTHKVVYEWGENYYSNVAKPWNKGDGTQESPYLIDNEAQLRALADYTNGGGVTVGKHWKQTADIIIPEGPEHYWTPIGDGTRSFQGSYDGGRFKIENLHVDRPSGGGGLFGYVEGGETHPILENIEISKGYSKTLHTNGLLVGRANGLGTIRKCSVKGDVTSEYHSVGGLVGSSSFDIENCCFRGAVSGDNSVGGLVGIINYRSDNDLTVRNSFVAATVTGKENVGAFAGGISPYAKTSVLFYETDQAGTLPAVGDGTQNANITGKSFAEFGTGEVTWLLNGCQADSPVWYQFISQDIRDSYPSFDSSRGIVYQWSKNDYRNEIPSFTGEGTKESPYLIATEQDFVNLSAYTNLGYETAGKYFKQTARLDFYYVSVFVGNEKHPFRGNYNGGNFPIDNYRIESNESCVGLFGCVDGTSLTSEQQPVIEGVYLSEPHFKGESATGAIVGSLKQATIRKCSVDGGYVSVKTNQSGGLIGYMENATIENCAYYGNVVGLTEIGGLVGSVSGKVNIRNSVARTPFVLTEQNVAVGSLVGFDAGNALTFSNCYYDAERSFNLVVKAVGDKAGGSSDKEGTKGATTEQINSGEVTWLLNGGQSENPIWYQELSHAGSPSLNSSVGIVYKWGNIYKNEPCPWGGDGTKESPFLISDEAGLRSLSDCVNNGKFDSFGMYWKQTANIDLGGEARPWIPIGLDSDHKFKGRFDGGGFAISNLYISVQDSYFYVGLFGFIAGQSSDSVSVIENVRLVNVNISSRGEVGGLICFASNSQILNCSVEGSVNRLKDPHSTGPTGGGILNFAESNVLIDNCAFKGHISYSAGGAGIVASLGEGSVVKNSYVSATFTHVGESDRCGAIVLFLKNKSNVFNCYYDSSLSGNVKGVFSQSDANSAAEATPKTTEQFNSGEVTWLLNGSQSDKPIWYQTLKTDAYPVLDKTSGVVYQWGNRYSNEPTSWNGHGTKENPFLISNELDLRAFGQYISAAKNNAEGCYWRQTADIDLGGPTRPWSLEWSNFKGNYDGGGYAIANLYSETSGLFAEVGGTQNTTYIENIRLVNVHINKQVADRFGAGAIAFMQRENAIIRNCFVSGKVDAPLSTDVGGLTGFSEFTVDNCAFVGEVTGGAEFVGGLAGGIDMEYPVKNSYAIATVTASGTDFIGALFGGNGFYAQNCYYDSTVSNGLKGRGERNGVSSDREGATAGKTPEQFHSGEVTWLLNGSQSDNPTWYQTLKTDAYPVLDKTRGVVYQWGNGYSNEPVSWNGQGTKENPFLISNESDLRAFGQYISASNNTEGCYWKQTADIDLGGTARPWSLEWSDFKGNYDGGGYAIANLYSETNGLFFGVGGIQDTTYIENIRLVKAYINKQVADRFGAGAIAFIQRGNAIIRNCFVSGKVDAPLSSDVGGLIGHSEFTVDNCAFVGEVTGVDRIGGLAGGIGMAYPVKNSYAIATVTASGTDFIGALFGGNGTYAQNCYYDSTVSNGLRGCGSRDGVSEDAEGATAGKTTEQFESGEVTWLLNGSQSENPVWYQTLNVDTYPVLDSSHKVVYNNLGSYSNERLETLWEGEGTASAPYLISNEQELRALSSYVKNGGKTMSIYWKLTADIDLGGKARPWISIGGANDFSGNFDGNGFVISNMYTEGGGFFENVDGSKNNVPIEIKNIYLKDVEVNSYFKAGALAGAVYYDVMIRNCYATGKVTTSSADRHSVGGLVGRSFSNITGCGFIGTVSGFDEVGGLVGYTESRIVSSYAVATVTGEGSRVGAITGYGSVYDMDRCGYGASKAGSLKAVGFDYIDDICNEDGDCLAASDAAIASGELTFFLNCNQPVQEPIWYQTLNVDPYPVLDKTHKVVYKSQGGYTNTRPLWLGDGTQYSPYMISTEDELFALATYTNSGKPTSGIWWMLTSSIQMQGKQRPWISIGTEEHPFRGTLYGCQNTISNMYIENGNGFFNCVEVPEVLERDYFSLREVILENVTVKGNKDNVGALVGMLKPGTSVFNSFITNSNVSGRNNVGGFVGNMQTGAIVKDCYFRGSVSGANMVGGFVGAANGTVTNCYTVTPKVTATAQISCSGMFAGQAESVANVDNCYYENTFAEGLKAIGYITSTSEANSEGNIGGKTAEEFASGEVAWRLSRIEYPNSVWGQEIGVDQYPSFYSMPVYLVEGVYTNQKPTWIGSGTQDDPYLVSSDDELLAMIDYVNGGNETAGKFWKQIDDIRLRFGMASGIGTETNPFKGTYDGGGCCISNYYADITEPGTNFGLFGVISGEGLAEGQSAGIKNLCLYGNSIVTSSDNVGAVVGKLKDAYITGCYVEMYDVKGNTSVGGLVGRVEGAGSLVDNCSYYITDVAGTDYVGAITGYSEGTITDCIINGAVVSAAAGAVNSGIFVGYSNSQKIANCYYSEEGSQPASVSVEAPVRVSSIIGQDVTNMASGCSIVPNVTGVNLINELGIDKWNYYTSEVPYPKTIRFASWTNMDRVDVKIALWDYMGDITAPVENVNVEVRAFVSREGYGIGQYPFALNAQQVSKTGKFYEYHSFYTADDGKPYAFFKEVETTQANKTYIFKLDKFIVPEVSMVRNEESSLRRDVKASPFVRSYFGVENVTLVPNQLPDISVAPSANGLYGTYDYVTLNYNPFQYYPDITPLNAYGVFNKFSYTDLEPMESFLWINGLPDNVDEISILLFDKTSDIPMISVDTEKGKEGIYNTFGQKLSVPQQGVNIINGVKVMKWK